MRRPFLEPLCPPDSPAFRAAPAWKLALALVMVSATALAPPAAGWFFGLVAALLLLLGLGARLRWVAALRRLLLLEPFVLGIALLALFQEDGLARFALMITRSTLCLAAMILLGATTSFAAILAVLRRARVPGLLVATLALTHRYLFVLLEEMHRMRRARLSRSFAARRAHHWHSLSTVIAQLFVRSSERAERIYAAMCARGWKP